MEKLEVILPCVGPGSGEDSFIAADLSKAERLCEWLQAKINYMRSVWMASRAAIQAPFSAHIEDLAAGIADILLHRRFNYQAKGRLLHLIPEVRRAVTQKLLLGRPITFFLLYNGGYRASPIPNNYGLNFVPDQTELMLLYQITRLQECVLPIYPPGIDFIVVINNGVAQSVNDIPLDKTRDYVAQLRKLIASIGASESIRLLVQSELPTFKSSTPLVTSAHHLAPSVKSHGLVERFLGRKCSVEEAQYRSALYLAAEENWGQELAPIVKAQSGIMMRQVSSPGMLSFRPFPGGATRIQNGSLGFYKRQETYVPCLVTSNSFGDNPVVRAPIKETDLMPFLAPEPAYV